MANLVWLDMEMTGLDPLEDKILEFAVIITDTDLNIIEEFQPVTVGHAISNLQFHLGENEDELLSAFRESGVLERVDASGFNIKEAEKILLKNIEKHCERKKCHLAGSGIWTDARFLMRQMPLVWDFLHYKLLDVTSIKLLRQFWYPEVNKFKKANKHDALVDIRESISQLQFYRKEFFK